MKLVLCFFMPKPNPILKIILNRSICVLVFIFCVFVFCSILSDLVLAERKPILLSPRNMTIPITIEILEDDVCNISLEIIPIKRSYENESIVFSNILTDVNSSMEYSIEYWLEDLSGNILQSRSTSKQGQKSFYVRKQQDASQGYWIKNRLLWLDCDVVAGKNESAEMVVLKIPNFGTDSEDSVNIFDEDMDPYVKETPKNNISTTNISINKTAKNADVNSSIKSDAINTGINHNSSQTSNISTNISISATNKSAVQTLKSSNNPSFLQNNSLGLVNILNSTSLQEDIRSNNLNRSGNNPGQEDFQVVYESSNAKSKKLVYYMILVVFACISIFTVTLLKTDKTDSKTDHITDTGVDNEGKRNKTIGR